ncbi:MAG: pitrilysin family protein [Bacillota bacterium]|nr:pitrilysin family protein [Bacillota bacterium]
MNPGHWVDLPWGERVWLGRVEGGPLLCLLPRRRVGTAWQWTVPLPGRLEKVRAGGEVFPVPQGTPHVLEHLLFQKAEGDFSLELARLGVEANAFTTDDYTAFYATGSAPAREVLPLLFSLVLEASFTADDVALEKLIIARELALDRDDPDHWRERALREALFVSPHLKGDLLGSRESLDQVHFSLLQRLHRLFYPPSRGILVGVGPLEPEKVSEAAASLLTSFSWPQEEAEIILSPEPKILPVSALEGSGGSVHPWAALAWKGEPLDLAAGLLTAVALEALLGRSSRWREEAEAEGAVDPTLAYGWGGGRRYPYLVVEGETEDPHRWFQAVEEGLGGRLFQEEVRRAAEKIRGRLLRSFDSQEEAASHLSESLYYGDDPGAFWDLLQGAGPEEVAGLFHRVLAGPGARVIQWPQRKGGQP